MSWRTLTQATLHLLLSIRVAISLPMPRLCLARGSNIFSYNIFSTWVEARLAQVTPRIFLCRNVSCTNKYILRILPLVASMYVLRLLIAQTDSSRELSPRSLINVLCLLYSYYTQHQVEALYCRPFVGRPWNGRSTNSPAELILGWESDAYSLALQQNVGTWAQWMRLPPLQCKPLPCIFTA